MITQSGSQESTLKKFREKNLSKYFNIPTLKRRIPPSSGHLRKSNIIIRDA